MDPNDYPGNQSDRANGFQLEKELPGSQDSRETRVEMDPNAKPNDIVAGNRANGNESIQVDQHSQQPTQSNATPSHPTDQPQPLPVNEAPQESSQGNEVVESPPTRDQRQGEEEQYAPGFPKKMEVVVLALVRMSVDLESDWVTELPKGTIVEVVEIVGRRAKISRPFSGWMSIRTDDGVTILTEPDGTVQIGARIVYKDFHKKASVTGTVIDKDDRRSMHCVQFETGAKEWMNLNCKEVEIISTGRDNKPTAQVNGTTQLNYFAKAFDPSGGGDEPAHRHGVPEVNGHDAGHSSNGLMSRRHQYGDDYHPGVGHHGGHKQRVVDPRYPDSRYPAHREMNPEYPYDPAHAWDGRSGSRNVAPQEAPPGLHAQVPPGVPARSHREVYDPYGRGPPAAPPDLDYAADYEHPQRTRNLGYPDGGPASNASPAPGGRGSRNVKGFIVLRGLPGSGKTTLAKKLASRAPKSRICTEDRYHWTAGEDGAGEYKFKREVLFFARDWCNKEVKNAVKNEIDLVILDNCNARISMYEELITFAVQHKYRFRIIEFIATQDLVDRYAARSIKGFPREVYMKLLKLWERDPRAELINPCFDDVDGPVPVAPPQPVASGPRSGMHRGGFGGRDMPPPPNDYSMYGSPQRGPRGPPPNMPPPGVGHAPPHAHGMRMRSRRGDYADGAYDMQHYDYRL